MDRMDYEMESDAISSPMSPHEGGMRTCPFQVSTNEMPPNPHFNHPSVTSFGYIPPAIASTPWPTNTDSMQRQTLPPLHMFRSDLHLPQQSTANSTGTTEGLDPRAPPYYSQHPVQTQPGSEGFPRPSMQSHEQPRDTQPSGHPLRSEDFPMRPTELGHGTGYPPYTRPSFDPSFFLHDQTMAARQESQGYHSMALPPLSNEFLPPHYRPFAPQSLHPGTLHQYENQPNQHFRASAATERHMHREPGSRQPTFPTPVSNSAALRPEFDIHYPMSDDSSSVESDDELPDDGFDTRESLDASRLANSSNRGATSQMSRRQELGLMQETNMERARAARRAAAISVKLVASVATIASFEKVDKASLDAEDQTCIICYNEFGVMNPDGHIECPVRLPKCKHLFGDCCLKQWLKDSDTCPYCRDKLASEPKRLNLQPEYNRRLFQAQRLHDAGRSGSGAQLRAFMNMPENQSNNSQDRARAIVNNDDDDSMARYDDSSWRAPYPFPERRAPQDSSSRHRRGRASLYRTPLVPVQRNSSTQVVQNQLQTDSQARVGARHHRNYRNTHVEVPQADENSSQRRSITPYPGVDGSANAPPGLPNHSLLPVFAPSFNQPSSMHSSNFFFNPGRPSSLPLERSPFPEIPGAPRSEANTGARILPALLNEGLRRDRWDHGNSPPSPDRLSGSPFQAIADARAIYNADFGRQAQHTTPRPSDYPLIQPFRRL